MRYVSFEIGGKASYGIATGNGIVDLGRRLGDRYPDLKSLIAAGLPVEASRAAAETPDFAEAEITFLPPIPNPDHIWCLALNYIEHHSEVESAGRVQELPKQPALFMRWADSFVGHEVPLQHPRVSEQFDYEGELAIVIGKPGRDIDEARAMEHVAGYTILNDGSVRDWQFHTRQITPGKNFYQSGSYGPYFVTRDEIADPGALRIVTTVNGQVVQDGTTADMVHGIARFIAYASTILPLRPGDILATGTPSGVGFSRKPPLWLKPGDSCEVAIDGLGKLTNRVQD